MTKEKKTKKKTIIVGLAQIRLDGYGEEKTTHTHTKRREKQMSSIPQKETCY